MEEKKIPGILVGIWELDLEPLILAKGVSNIETNDPLKDTDKFRIASHTKTFTAAVILQLVDEGCFSLDDTIEGYFPEVPNSHVITIRQLLNMSAGIYDFYYLDPRVGQSYLDDPLRVWTSEELYQYLIEGEPDYYPGTSAAYSNANYFLLGLLIEEVTGNTVEDEIRTRLLDPLGMNSTSFPTDPEMTGNYVHGYRDKNYDGVLEDISRVEPSLPWAAGAMISNLHDMKTWVREMYHGTLLSREIQAERLETVSLYGDFVSYGLGLLKLQGFVGHDGGILGYGNVAMYLPEKDAVVICMINRSNDDGSPTDPNILDLWIKIARILYPDVFVRQPGL